MITHSYYNVNDLFIEGFFLDEEGSRYIWYRKKGTELFEFFAGDDVSKIRKTVQLISGNKKDVSAISHEKFDEIYDEAVRAEHCRLMLINSQNQIRGELEKLVSKI